MTKNVVWISGGVSSFIAGYLVKNEIDEWIYIDIEDQHPDTLRFIYDCEKHIGKNVTILRSDEFPNVESVIRKTKIANTPHGAACTGILKKAVRKKWENEQYRNGVTSLCYFWGMDSNEYNRAMRLKENFPEFEHRFPLIEKGLSKQDCHAILDRIGVKRPKMYDLGYNNNNCIGCVKGGQWYWNKIRRDFPDVYEKRASLEREIGHTYMNGLSLDELKPGMGRKSDEITTDCSIICHLTMMDIKEEDRRKNENDKIQRSYD